MADIYTGARIQDLPEILAKMAKDPIGSIKHPARLTWPAAFTLQILAAILSGGISAVIEKSILNFAISIFVFPLVTIMAGAIFTLFIYYYFAIFTSTFLDMRRLYSLVVMTAIPYFAIHAVSGFIPPIDLIGFAIMSILLVVGLVEQFGLGHKPVLALLGFAFVIFALVWSAVQMFNG